MADELGKVEADWKEIHEGIKGPKNAEADRVREKLTAARKFLDIIVMMPWA